MIVRFENHSGDVLVIENGRIADDKLRPDRIVRVGAGYFYPGLINAHDHLHRNHFPRLGSPPYEDAYVWGADIHARHSDAIARARQLDRRDALLFGALKNILGGVTTVVHHDAWERFFDDDFPIRVARVRPVHSLGFERDLDAVLRTGAPPGLPLCIHLAEGTNRRAAEEVVELSRLGVVNQRLLAVHTLGVDAGGIELLRAAGAAVVWCPTSNRFLFGTTAPRALFDSGIDILLGTDSLLTGDGTLLDELRAAHCLGYLTDERLLASVGEVAARRLGLPVPALEGGAPADIIVLRAPLLSARAADIALVVVGGRPVFADESIDDVNVEDGQVLSVGGVRKLVLASLVRAAERAVALFPECGRIFTLQTEELSDSALLRFTRG